MANVGENLKQILQGSSGLPDSAGNLAQKPLPPGIGFGWKPSDEQTKKDIAQADYRDRAIRDAVMERKLSLERARKPVVESKPVTPRPTIGGQLKSLIEGLGKGAREAGRAVLDTVIPDAGANQIQEALGVKNHAGISMQSAVELRRLEEQLNPKEPKEAPPTIREDKGLTQEKEFEKVMGKDAAARRKAKQEADRKRLMGK